MNGRRSKARQEIDWNDPFDPRTWEEPLPYVPIYLDRYGDYFAIVDREDYATVMRFMWSLCYSSDVGKRWRKGEDMRHRMYARNEAGGKRTLLHHFIMRDVSKPSDRHFIIDHKNGQGLDCRRSNLRWVTPSENGMNRYGFYAKQQQLPLPYM